MGISPTISAEFGCHRCLALRVLGYLYRGYNTYRNPSPDRIRQLGSRAAGGEASTSARLPQAHTSRAAHKEFLPAWALSFGSGTGREVGLVGRADTRSYFLAGGRAATVSVRRRAVAAALAARGTRGKPQSARR